MLDTVRLRPAAALAVLLPGVLLAAPATGASRALTGTFGIAAAECATSAPSGSYFRMILHNGTASGPFLSNSDSPCRDQTYTPLAPGRDGGLRAGSYQPQPSPAFDSAGNGRAGAITAPARFFGVRFATATNPVDPQTSTRVPAPSITRTGSRLTGDLRSFAVSWNNQQFNQGSPRPDGSSTGNTSPVTGTIDAATGAYSLQWTSEIHGGPFDGFTGLWHLTGTYTDSSPSGPSPRTTDSGTSAATPTTGSPAGSDRGGSAVAPPATASGGSVSTAPPVASTPGATAGPTEGADSLNTSPGGDARAAAPPEIGGGSATGESPARGWWVSLAALLLLGAATATLAARRAPRRSAP